MPSSSLVTQLNYAVEAANIVTTPIDITLTARGAAADAQATGDAIREVSDYVGAGDLPGSGQSILECLVAIYNLIGNTPVPSGSQTLSEALNAVATEIGDGIDGKTLTEAIGDINEFIGDAALPLQATTISEALNAVLSASVRSVNGHLPDASGGVEIDTGVMTVNGNEPDANGNIQVETGIPGLNVNGETPDENGTISINTGVLTINGEAPDENGDVDLGDMDGFVRTINDVEPDEQGNINLNHVALADDLYSEDTQQNSGTFIARMAGGSASIADNTVSIKTIRGSSIRTGYVPETRNVSVTLADPYSEDPVTVSVDWDTFIAQISGAQTSMTITYDGEDWDYVLETYGVTVTGGTPAEGDAINLSYVPEVRGQITNTFPTSFSTTGWNLYDNTTGYARVIHYSDEYGYRIDGTYSSITFCTAPGETETSVTVDTNGLFNIEEDGYIHIIGGNNTDTTIYPTWSDWISGTPNEYQSYYQYTIPLTVAINAIFAAGLCSVGDTKDELNPFAQTYTRRINRLAYSIANLESVIALGTDYTYDEEYIYYVLEEPITGTYSMSNTIPVSSHGLEFFDSDTPVDCSMIYQAALKDKLRRDVLTISAQDLSKVQKTQARENIGASKMIRVPHDTTMVVANQTSEETDLICSISNSEINNKMVVANMFIEDPGCQVGKWTVTTYTGSVQIKGICSAQTKVSLILFERE